MAGKMKTSANTTNNIAGALERASRLFWNPVPMGELLNSFVILLSELFNVEQVVLLMLDEGSGDLTVAACSGISPTEAKKYRLPAREGIVGQVLSKKRTLLLRNGGPLLKRHYSAREPEAVFYIPLTVGCRTYGVITLGRAGEQRLFTPEKVKLASSLAAYIAAMLENSSLNREISDLSLNYLRSLAMAIEVKDYYTRLHSMRVTRFAVATGVRMGWPQSQTELLRWGALLHDIGKIGIGDDILLKPGNLTREEFKIIQGHPEIGARIIGEKGQFKSIIPMVLFHHERYDGSGYPYGLKGEDIPVEAKIIAVADAFEAMTADRPYRRAYQMEEAVRELWKNAGSQFDPVIVKVFMEVMGDESVWVSMDERKSNMLTGYIGNMVRWR